MSRGAYCMNNSCYMNKHDNRDVAFFNLPKDRLLAKQWIVAVNREDLLRDDRYLKSHYQVCSKHFSCEQFKKTYPRILLKAGAVPMNMDVLQQIIIKTSSEHAFEGIEHMDIDVNTNNVSMDMLRMHEDFQTSSSTAPQTPVNKGRSVKQYTPRTKRKLDRYKLECNKLKCKLFRRKKLSACFCYSNMPMNNRISTRRARVCFLIKESKKFLSKDSHMLFVNELKSSLVIKCNRRYTDDMKQLCLSWYYSSPKGYRNAALTLNLPSPRSIRSWQSLLHVHPGTNNAMLQSIKVHMNNSKHETEQFTSLLFDEIGIKEGINYNSSEDKIIGVVDDGESRTNEKAKSALVCMATGITHRWKHILGYWFLGAKQSPDKMKNIVVNCINAAADAGLIVKAIVCDQGPLNQGLAKALKISKEMTYFLHNGEKIYFLFDVPHLIKSMRNNLSKYDLKWDNKIVSWKHIKTTVESTHPIRVRMLPKIGFEHLNINNFNSMKVKYATQVFSDAMSVALLVMKHLQIVEPGAEATSAFVKDMDTIFDCLNSIQLKPDKIKMRYAISEDSPHEKCMREIYNKFETASFLKAKRHRPPSLNGWQITISSVLQLAEELRKDHSIPRLLTRPLDQDALENFFAVVRQQHGCCKNPTAEQFENGLRHTYITSISKLSSNSNCENDYNIMLTNLRSLSNSKKAARTSTSLPVTSNVDCSKIPELIQNVSVLDENAIYYVSGYYCRKFLKIHNCEICKAIILDKEKHLVGEHQLFTYFRQSDVLDYKKEGLFFPANEIYEFLKIIEIIHSEHFKTLLQSKSLTTDFINIVRGLDNIPVVTLCSEVAFDLFLTTFLKIRHHWAARLENKNRSRKVVSNNQKLKNIIHE